MTAESLATKLPAYVAFPTFARFITGLCAHPLPDRIEIGLMSRSSHSSLLASLKFLDLIDGEKRPTPALKALATSERPVWETFREILENSYAAIFSEGSDLEQASEEQLEEQFRDKGISGSTEDKAVSFFLSAAKRSGVPLSPDLKAARRRTAAARILRLADGSGTVALGAPLLPDRKSGINVSGTRVRSSRSYYSSQ